MLKIVAVGDKEEPEAPIYLCTADASRRGELRSEKRRKLFAQQNGLMANRR